MTGAAEAAGEAQSNLMLLYDDYKCAQETAHTKYSIPYCEDGAMMSIHCSQAAGTC